MVPITMLSNRAFNQNISAAKEAASKGPVFITDHGRPAHVLLTIKAYRRLTGEHLSLAQALEQQDANADFAFDPAKLMF
jgi:prevent-host-death family protein